jgi:uncharacterized protein
MGKKEMREFEIQFVNLTTGEHIFDFEISERFFQLFPETLVEHGEGKAHLKLLKTDNMLTLLFEINVDLTLTCDISLKTFIQPVQVEKRMLVKFGEEESEPDEEVVIITHDRISINVASWIHEFVNLEIPMKKVHPDLIDSDRPDMAYTSHTEDDDSNEKIDPRWEALKKLKE